MNSNYLLTVNPEKVLIYYINIYIKIEIIKVKNISNTQQKKVDMNSTTYMK